MFEYSGVTHEIVMAKDDKFKHGAWSSATGNRWKRGHCPGRKEAVDQGTQIKAKVTSNVDCQENKVSKISFH